MSLASPNRRIAFGDYVADLDSFELRKHGLKLKIQDQPFQILRMLLENPGQLVTRERLRDELWTQSTFVDFDAGLNAAVRRLRDVLNDSADDPRYVETLPRHGYRFIAEIRKLAVEGPTGREPLAPVYTESTEPTPRLVQVSADAKPSVWIVLTPVVVFGALLILVLGLQDSIRNLFVSHASSPIRSIAVLPLANLSGDPARDYFADGMTDALITDLAHINSLRIISRNSTVRYKATEKTIPEIAHELNVDAVVEGSIVQDGNHVRISAQLIRAVPEEHLWAKIYDRDLSDVLALQGQVAQDIATQVRVTLSPQERVQISKIETQNPEAYQAYLLGRFYRTRGDVPDGDKGITYLHRAIELDPTFVSPYVEIGQQYCFYGDLPEGRDGARKLIATALQLDPMSAEAHAVQGCFYLRQDWDFARAEQEYRRAVELGANSALAHEWMSNYFWLNNQQVAAMDEAQVARALDPLSLENNIQIGLIFYSQRRYAEAAKQFWAVTEMDPRFYMAHRHLLRVYDQSQDIPHALEVAKWWFCDPCDRECDRTKQLRSIYEKSGADAYWTARVQLEEANAVAEAHGDSVVGSFPLAELHARLGHKERALMLLDRLYAQRHDGLLMWLKSNPAFDSLRDDPRFQDLIRRVGFPTDQAARTQ